MVELPSITYSTWLQELAAAEMSIARKNFFIIVSDLAAPAAASWGKAPAFLCHKDRAFTVA